MFELVQLGYLPMVVTPGPNPSGMLAKPSQMVASGLLETSGHIGHVLEWSEFLDTQPLTILAFIHDPDELVLIIVPLSAAERGNLAGIKTPHHMDQVPSPTQGYEVHEVIHWIFTVDPSLLSRSSGGGPVSPCPGARSRFLVTSTLPRLWSPSSDHTLALASAGSSFSPSGWGSKPHLPRWVYRLPVWGGWSRLITSRGRCLLTEG